MLKLFANFTYSKGHHSSSFYVCEKIYLIRSNADMAHQEHFCYMNAYGQEMNLILSPFRMHAKPTKKSQSELKLRAAFNKFIARIKVTCPFH